MNTEFYNSQNFNGIEIGITLEKSSGPTVPVYIPSILPYVSGGSKIKTKNSAPNALNILNINGRNGISGYTTSNYIDLRIPLYVLEEFHPTHIVPKGTKLMIGFPGGEINNPRIIGLY